VTQTLDVWRCLQTGELTVIMSGMDQPPAVANVDNGASIVLRPAKVDLTMGRFGLSTLRDAGAHEANAWWGELPTAKETEAHIALTIDGQIRFVTVSWPERKQPEPQPEPPAKRKPRGRPRKTGALQ